MLMTLSIRRIVDTYCQELGWQALIVRARATLER